jgi:thioredoxin 1
MVQHVTSEQLEQLIAQSDIPVFCDFWASWCGPCRMLAPVLDELSTTYEGKARFVKVNVDEEEKAAMRYGITSIPNVIAFKGGKAVDNSLGFVPAPVLSAFVEKNL